METYLQSVRNAGETWTSDWHLKRGKWGRGTDLVA